jgi:hypothetical protein
MKRVPLVLVLALFVLGTSVQAQEQRSTTRIEKQHEQTASLKKQLKQTEESVLEALQGDNRGNQRAALQTLRDLEQIFPVYPFSKLLEPLGDLLKDENADPVARKLAALALDELHSDAGDAMIREVAGGSDDEGLQSLCQALLVGSSQD